MSKLHNLVYDDLQVAISDAKIPTANAPTWVDWNYGIAGGVTFPVLAFDVGELLYFYIQTTHSTDLSTMLDHHIHYSVPSDSAGDRFQFQLDVIGAPINGQFAALASSPFAAEHTLGAAESGYHKLFDIAQLDAINTTVSTLYVCKLERIAATVDEYGSAVYVIFTDCHTLRDSNGSITETSK